MTEQKPAQPIIDIYLPQIGHSIEATRIHARMDEAANHAAKQIIDYLEKHTIKVEITDAATGNNPPRIVELFTSDKDDKEYHGASTTLWSQWGAKLGMGDKKERGYLFYLPEPIFEALNLVKEK
jgi:hypothetical protein